MASLVLFSTFSFTVNMHYCGDSLKDIAVFQTASTCEMDAKDAQNDCDGDFMPVGCCSDKVVQIEGQDTFKLSFDKLNKSQQDYIAIFVYAYFSLFEEPANQQTPYRNYTPPLLTGDIQVLHQTFLI